MLTFAHDFIAVTTKLMYEAAVAVPQIARRLRTPGLSDVGRERPAAAGSPPTGGGGHPQRPTSQLLIAALSGMEKKKQYSMEDIVLFAELRDRAAQFKACGD